MKDPGFHKIGQKTKKDKHDSISPYGGPPSTLFYNVTLLLSAASSKDMVLKLEPFGIFQEVYSQEGTWEVKTDVGSVPFGLLVEISLN